MIVAQERKKFFSAWGDVQLHNLIDIQTKSYEDFLQKDVFTEKRKRQGLQELFEEIFPICSYDEKSKLEFISYRFEIPRNTQEECLERGTTYEAALQALFRLSDEEGVKEEEVFVGYFPIMTENGSFIINGSERVLVSQIHRSPGIYFEKENTKTKADGAGSTLTFKIMPYRGSWLVAGLDSNDLIYIYMEKNKKRRRVLATTFLRAIGLSKNIDILEKFYEIEKVSIDHNNFEDVIGMICASTVYDQNEATIIASGDSLTTATAMHAIKAGVKEIEVAKGASSSDSIIKMIRADLISNHKDALKHCFRKMYPDEPATLSNARFGLMRFFFDKNRYSLGEVGRYKINKSLGLPIDEEALKNTLLTQSDIVLAIQKMLDIKNKKDGVKLDDIDDLSNRRVRLCGELVKNQCRIGLVRLEKVVKEKLSISDLNADNITPGKLVSSKMITAAVKEFFARSQLSQFMDHTNPLSEISHKRRLSALGAGGIQRERAGLEVRDVHSSHYGRICPVETPEGPSIGLITSLAMYARINRFGFIETPYFKVKNGKVSKEYHYYSSDEEFGLHIAQGTTEVDDNGKIIPEQCLVRKDLEIMEVPRSSVDLIEVDASQLFSAGTNLIPFLENDDTNRALMGANMQRQAVPVLNPTAPIVGTGFEKKVAVDAGAVVVSDVEGKVKYVDGNSIVIITPENIEREFSLKKFKRSNSGMCVNYRPVVKPGEAIAKGDVIADGAASENGELALGKNIFVAFMPFYGKNFEDAIVVSEEVIKKDMFTAVRIDKVEITSRETNLGKEEITRDIPNVSEESLKNLDEEGIVKVGSRVKADDILVGRVTPKVEGDLSPEERFLRAIFKDKAQNVKDTSLVAPIGVNGVVVDVKVFSRKDKANKADDIIQVETEASKSDRKRYNKLVDQVDEALVNSLNKKLVEEVKVAPEALLHSKTGKIIIDKGDKFSPEIITKIIEAGSDNIIDMNIPLYSDIREIIKESEVKKRDISLKYSHVLQDAQKKDTGLRAGVIKHIVIHIAHKSPIEIGDKIAGRHGNKGILSSIIPVEDMPFTEDGRPVQMILSTLGVPSRMNLGQLNEIRLGMVGNIKNERYSCPVFRGCIDEQVSGLLSDVGIDGDVKEYLYNGKTGDRFINKVAIGYMYILRLNHFIADKMHARATGPYSFITQQPLGGKSRFGGQRFGEMEFWAAEAYGAANLLLEMLTVKSDDIVGRTMIYQNIVNGEPILKTTQTESLSVLTKELMGLCLDVRLENSANSNSNEKNQKSIDDSTQTKQELIANSLNEIEQNQFNKFDKLTLRLASENVIKNSWSHGEVKKAETTNYRTMRPEIGGLFCEKIFGPTKDWECACGKHKKVKQKGVVCDRCGVEINVSRVRRQRMAHIDLAIPVVHIWLLKNVPSRLGHLLGMLVSHLESIIYYEQYVVIDPKDTGLARKKLMSHAEYQENKDKYGEDAFVADIGGQAIKLLLQSENLYEVEVELKQAVKQARSAQARMKLARRLRTIDGFLKSGNELDSLVLSCIPVIPPDIRPLIKLEGGRNAASDINDLYRRLIYRNLRLKLVIKVEETPMVIIRNEMRLLQEAVDAVFDNGRRNTAITGAGNRVLKPIAQSLRGKHGRFRQNLLGKRVDYSGRSVIVVGPELKLNQCGIPKDMAIQMFEPFIVRQLRIKNKSRTVRAARRIIQRKTKDVWEIIEPIINSHVVILNRAPTLHRLSIQAFRPVLVEGKAIRLHPLVCAAFNADFDGDQMAVHVPLSVDAQIEARLFMMAADNIFLPSSGKPIAMPTRDMTLGVYGLMMEPLVTPRDADIKTFSSFEEVMTAISQHSDDYQKQLGGGREGDFLGYGLFLHEKIKVRHSSGFIYTTPGRVIFNSIVPKELEFQNYSMSQEKLSDLIMLCYSKLGLERTAVFLDDLKDIGFNVSTDFAVSISLGDICKPREKKAILKNASKQVKKINDQLSSGIITEGEAESRIIAVWSGASDKISADLFEALEARDGNNINPLNIILMSGARGNKSQIRQLGGMRGLVAKPSGDIITFPVRGSFREGLSPIEFFISTHGGRKGLADTALKTADAGYLTRRLVDVAQEIVISEYDCLTISGIEVTSISSLHEESLSLGDRIKGRFLAVDVVDLKSNKVIALAGTMVDHLVAEEIEKVGIKSVLIRSPLTCDTERGVCSKCYGINLADGKVAVPGEAVGIIAAQSIGEPGTQLTMRTFHLGGVASTSINPEWVSEKSGVAVFKDLRYLDMENEESPHKLLIGRSGALCIVEDSGRSHDEYVEMIKSNSIEILEQFKSEIGAKVYVSPGDILKVGTKIADVETDSVPMIAEQSGYVSYQDLVEGVTIEQSDGAAGGMVVKHYSEDLCPIINIVDKNKKVIGAYSVPSGAVLSVKDGDAVALGTYLARIPRSAIKTQDITGGLARVAEIVEARKPAQPAEIAEIEGIIEFRGAQKNKRVVAIVDPEDSSIFIEHFIPLNKQLIVHSGDIVSAGQRLTSGVARVDEVLRICGVKQLQRQLVDQIQEVYRLQGVDINDKHIEIIVKKMMGKLSIVDHGDATKLLYGDEITRKEFDEINAEIIIEGGRPAKAKPILLGITRAALSTDSLISAASFQNPTERLLDAAIRGSTDHLIGCKENIIVANKMPAGTGFQDEKHGAKREDFNFMGDSFEDNEEWNDRISTLTKRVEALKETISKKIDELIKAE